MISTILEGLLFGFYEYKYRFCFLLLVEASINTGFSVNFGTQFLMQNKKGPKLNT